MSEGNEVLDSNSTQHCEGILDVLGDLSIVFKKVKADGKFDLNDTVHVLPVINKVPEYVEKISKYKEAFAELKKPSVSKFLKLVTIVDKKVKEFEKA